MPPDDMDIRVRTLENSHQKLEILIQHLTDAIDEIKNSIKDALDFRGKVENHTSQLNQLWPKVETLHSAMEEVDRKLDSITLSCEICRKDIQSERVWRNERIGNAVDWAVKGIALILIVITGIFYAWKNGLIK